jgi:diguanylate cyclase (GGDEF)-like protein
MGLDSSRLRLRVQVIGAGVWVTYLLCLALAGWLVVTWDRPYREPIAALIAAGVLGAFVVSRLPAERIVRSRYREAFFVTWSVVDVALICLIAYLDGGLTSPAALMLFMTLVFAATSYPLGSMVVVVIASVTGVATIGLLGGATERAFEADPAYVWVFLVSMALSGILCMWQSRLGERQREELAELSRTDPLTGCLNRRGFSERFDAELARGQVALIQLDLDDFKSVNDRHGHAAGDELLRWVGSTLKALLRSSDATGRLGGDEFGLLLPGLSPDEARAVADRTVAALAERIGAAVGVASSPADGATGEELHRHADAELYRRKSSTRAG